MEISSDARQRLDACIQSVDSSVTNLRVVRVERLGDRLVEIVLANAWQRHVVIEWGEAGDLARPAFARGPHCVASYNRRPGAFDLDDALTPEPLRRVTQKLCEALAGLKEAVSLGPPARDRERTSTPDSVEAIDALVDAIGVAVERDLGTAAFPNTEGWQVQEVRAFTYWRRVVDIRLGTGQKQLAFIVFPSDPQEKVYARTATLDVVYYSDDMDAKDHHGHLYERDSATIDTFVAWLNAWDLPS
jgi:hypothetical protein